MADYYLIGPLPLNPSTVVLSTSPRDCITLLAIRFRTSPGHWVAYGDKVCGIQGGDPFSPGSIPNL